MLPAFPATSWNPGHGGQQHQRTRERWEGRRQNSQPLTTCEGPGRTGGDSHPLISFLREPAHSPRLHFLLVPSPQGVLKRQTLTVVSGTANSLLIEQETGGKVMRGRSKNLKISAIQPSSKLAFSKKRSSVFPFETRKLLSQPSLTFYLSPL